MLNKYLGMAAGCLMVLVAIFHWTFVNAIPSEMDSHKYFEFPRLESNIKFGGVESSLSQLVPTSSSKVLLDATTESSLSKAVARLPADMTQGSLERVRLLIHKSYIGEYGGQLSALFLQFRRYKHAEEHFNLSLDGISSVQKERAILQRRKALQIEYLGEDTAMDLYGTQNELASILIDLRILDTNTNLSAKEKSIETRRLQNKLSEIMQN